LLKIIAPEIEISQADFFENNRSREKTEIQEKIV